MFEKFTSFFKKKVESEKPKSESTIYVDNRNIAYNEIIDDYFDGEKTPGELGAILNTKPEYLKIRLRAYDMNLKTDIVKIITGKFFKWVIGSGLKLQAEPNIAVLKMNGITIDSDQFKEDIENSFFLYAKSKYSDYTQKTNLHKRALEAYETAFLGGDCLCIIRFEDFGANIEVIDGQCIETPLDDSLKDDGNRIVNGIELDKKNKHVAFWVKDNKEFDDVTEITHSRIKAKINDIEVAWMVYGDKHRITDERGISKLAPILEKVAKLDRYVEASVKKAEETANVVYAFKHMTNSTGENILAQSLSTEKEEGEENLSAYEKNGRTANSLRQSTSGTVMNLTPDSDLIALSSDFEGNFKEFFRAVFTVLCSAMDIPEEVALQKYEQSYSSSRAAINNWEHLIGFARDEHSRNFYDKFYRAWLLYETMNDRLKVPDLLTLVSNKKKNVLAEEAFFNARFTGKKMPHIDPLKEAKAIRELLGDKTALISREQATEMMNAGDWKENYSKFLKEGDMVELTEAEDLARKSVDNNTESNAKPKKDDSSKNE